LLTGRSIAHRANRTVIDIIDKAKKEGEIEEDSEAEYERYQIDDEDDYED